MGSSKLKKKIKLHYQKQRASSETICCTCNHYVPDFKRMGIGDDLLLSIEPRCKIMGLENSISYRVRPDHGCDVHDNSEYMRRYGIL